MIRLLIRAGVSVGSAALGLLLSAWLLNDFHVQFSGFVIAVLVLATAQSILAPIVTRLAQRHAAALLGGVGIVSTLLALLLANLVPNGITVTNTFTWVVAALIVWACTALGAWLLVAVILKDRDGARSK